MASHLSRADRSGTARLRRRVAGFFDLLECGCVGGAAIDGTCIECGAPAYL